MTRTQSHFLLSLLSCFLVMGFSHIWVVMPGTSKIFLDTSHPLKTWDRKVSAIPDIIFDRWFASTIRVRLLHATVRQRILSLEAAKPGYYDVEAWGVPINDLDSIATIATFSATLIWLSLPRQGIYLRKQEIEDYVALWRYIAYLVGCPTEHFATPDKAKKMMDAGRDLRKGWVYTGETAAPMRQPKSVM